MLIAMGGSPGSLAAAVSSADSGVTVLDDRVDAEDHATYMWLRAHKLHGPMGQPVVLNTELLSAPWKAKTRSFHDSHGAEMYLRDLARDHAAMARIKTVAQSLNTGSMGALPDNDAMGIVASSLVSGRAWVMEFPKQTPKSRFVTKVSPDALTPINARLGTKVDFAFIASLEGDQWLRGYIPISKGKVIGQSGMTVATGFDVGQWGLDDLQKFGFSKQLIDKLKPYVGVKFRDMSKPQVIARIGKLGPVPELTKAEADTCDAAVFGKMLKDALTLWNGLSFKHHGPLFAALPAGWQTVWFSRVYQEGLAPRSADAIAFRDAAIRGNWQEAILGLRAYREYKARANQEADLLTHELPASSPVRTR